MTGSPHLPVIRVWIGLSGPTVDEVIWHIGDEERGKIGTAEIGSPDIWSEITPYVRSWSFRRGASRGDGVILRYEAGTATFDLNNGDRRFDPTNLEGPYTAGGVTQLVPMVRVKITAEWDGTAYRLWTGFADAWTPDYNSPTWSTVSLTATDAFKIFAAVNRRPLGLAVGAGENSGQRVLRILNAIQWPVGERVVAAGDSTLQATTMEGSVLNELFQVADSEAGEVWMGADGKIRFRNRNRLLEDVRSSTPQATFGDRSSAGSVAFAEDFESGIGSWTADNDASVSLEAGIVHGGSTSLKTLVTGSPTIVYTRTTSTPVTVGHRYRLRFWIYVVGGFNLSAAIDWSDGGYLSTSYTSYNVPDSVWTLVETTGTAPVGAIQAGYGPTLFVNVSDTIPTGLTYYIDDLSFTDLDLEIPYTSASVQNDDSTMANKVSVSIVGGTEQVAEDLTSQLRYLLKVYQKSDLILQTDADALQYAKYVLYQSKDPELRFADVSFGVPRPELADYVWPVLLGRELGDRVTVIRRPPGGGDPNYRDNFIRGIEMSSDGVNLTTKYQLQSATKFQFWTIGDPTYGRVGMNAISW